MFDTAVYTGVPSSVRVDSDLRQLYAIGKIDDYELLKKEVAESKVVLSAIERRLQEQLVKYQSLNTSEVGRNGPLSAAEISDQLIDFQLQFLLCFFFFTGTLP